MQGRMKKRPGPLAPPSDDDNHNDDIESIATEE